MALRLAPFGVFMGVFMNKIKIILSTFVIFVMSIGSSFADSPSLNSKALGLDSNPYYFRYTGGDNQDYIVTFEEFRPSGAWYSVFGNVRSYKNGSFSKSYDNGVSVVSLPIITNNPSLVSAYQSKGLDVTFSETGFPPVEDDNGGGDSIFPPLEVEELPGAIVKVVKVILPTACLVLSLILSVVLVKRLLIFLR